MMEQPVGRKSFKIGSFV